MRASRAPAPDHERTKLFLKTGLRPLWETMLSFVLIASAKSKTLKYVPGLFVCPLCGEKSYFYAFIFARSSTTGTIFPLPPSMSVAECVVLA